MTKITLIHRHEKTGIIQTTYNHQLNEFPHEKITDYINRISEIDMVNWGQLVYYEVETEKELLTLESDITRFFQISKVEKLSDEKLKIKEISSMVSSYSKVERILRVIDIMAKDNYSFREFVELNFIQAIRIENGEIKRLIDSRAEDNRIGL